MSDNAWTADVDARFHAHIAAAVRLHELKQGGNCKVHWYASQIVKNERNAAGDGSLFELVACSGDVCTMLHLEVADDETDALAMADVEYHAHVLASVAHHAEKSGQHWHLSAVQKASMRADGGVALGLVLCSGQQCVMMSFDVGADLSVESKARF